MHVSMRWPKGAKAGREQRAGSKRDGKRNDGRGGEKYESRGRMKSEKKGKEGGANATRYKVGLCQSGVLRIGVSTQSLSKAVI